MERVVTYCPLFTSAQLLYIPDVVFTFGLLEADFLELRKQLVQRQNPVERRRTEFLQTQPISRVTKDQYKLQPL